MVIRNIHHSIPTDETKKLITDLGFSVLKVSIIFHRVKKYLFPLFFVNLNHNEHCSEACSTVQEGYTISSTRLF